MEIPMTNMPKQVCTFESNPVCENLLKIEGCLVIGVLKFSRYLNSM